MSRTHPPTLLKLVRRTIDDELGLRRGDVVVVAVSGGPDSTALLHVLANLLPPRHVHVVAHGVDHGLRAAAGAELARAAELAATLGVEFGVTQLAVSAGSNLMARARAARYGALRQVLAGTEHPRPTIASGRRFLATGHHADDRAETVVIRLLQGSGPAGLAVLPAASSDLVRPMIRARRADVLAHLARHRLASSEDPTNAESRFLRTRVRREVMPLLLALAPGIVEHLCAVADALADVRAKAQEQAGGSATHVPAAIEGVALGRAQRNLLERAFRARNARARVPLRGDVVARVDLTNSRIVVTKGK
jgi:tRNA(Ile)-lysidine synthase